MNTTNLQPDSLKEKGIKPTTDALTVEGNTLFIAMANNSSNLSTVLAYMENSPAPITEIITTTDEADDALCRIAYEREILCTRVSRKYEDNILRIVANTANLVIIEEPLTEFGVFNHINAWMTKGIFKDSLLLPVTA